MVSTGTSSDAPLPCEKRRALFHSTLEPKHQRCSASLSQSQRSFTFVNSISTLLNKGGTHANVLMLLRTPCFSKTSIQVHSHSARTSVRRHERSEGRRPRFQEQTQSNTHFFKDAPKASRVLLCSSCTLQASHVKLKARNTFKPSSKHAMSMPVSANTKQTVQAQFSTHAMQTRGSCHMCKTSCQL